MSKYEFNSVKFNCAFQVKYSHKGNMVGFEVLNDDGLPIENLVHVLDKCLSEAAFLEFTKSRKIPVTKIMEDISFENFWNTYNYKEGGSKKKAEAIFLKLSDKDKSAAINYIAKYKRIKAKEGTPMAYATTYLNGQLWNN